MLINKNKLGIILFSFANIFSLLNDIIVKSFLPGIDNITIILIRQIWCIYFINLTGCSSKIVFSFSLIFRSILTLIGFYYTTIGIIELPLSSISAMYFSIPLFSVLLSWFFKVENTSLISSIFFIILLLIYLYSFSFSMLLAPLIGCFAFALCNVLMSLSREEEYDDIKSVSFYTSIFALIFLIFGGNHIIPIVKSIFNPYVFILGFSTFICQIMFLYAFKMTKMSKLSPFMFLNLLLVNIIDKIYTYNLLITIFIVLSFVL